MARVLGAKKGHFEDEAPISGKADIDQTPRDVRLDATTPVVAEVDPLELALVEPQRRPHLVDAEARRARDVLGGGRGEEREGRVYSHRAFNSWP